MKIVVMGSYNTDMIVKVPHIPKPGETVLGGKFTTAPGGKGANQAVAAARIGGDVTFIARVGDDSLGKEAIKRFESENINTKYIKRDLVDPSGVALIVVDKNGQNSIAVALGANSNLSPSDVDDSMEIIESAEILLTQLETPLSSVEKVISLAKAAGTKVVLNPAPAQALSDDLLHNITVITPNESESEALTGIAVTDFSSAEKAADVLLYKGIKTVVITMGEKGALLKTNSCTQIINPLNVDAVDATAAGDVFNGALVVAMAEGNTLEASVEFANAAAAFSVTKLGAQPSAPNRTEVDMMLNN
ncbi:MAG: ribokinase [Candidatus Marinimicrobia bacterium]|nr:ribokinase [Candidatus Neomarinimicrobiota bacterium]|tara:strand:+ start:6211 stop:7122 length:912 start_codon:yes stop_codon:yes gene_type:complete